MFASKIKPVEEDVEIKHMQEMKEAYNKIFKINCSRTRDTLNWKKPHLTMSAQTF